MMDIHLVSFMILFTLYLVQEITLTRRFILAYAKQDNFLGKRAPNATQTFFGEALYLVLDAYVIAVVYIATGFDFWGIVSNVRPLMHPAITIAGIVFGVGSLVVMVIARVQLGQSWRVGLDYGTEDILITQGIYRWVRNPYFSGYLGLQLGLFFVAPNTAALFAFVLNVVLLNFQVLQEEVFLAEKYGQAYRVYMTEAGRFFPRLRKLQD